MASGIELSCMGNGVLRCSLNLSANVLSDFPIYSSPQSTQPTCVCKSLSLFCSMLSLSLGVLDSVASFEIHFYIMLLADVLTALT